MAKLSEIPGTAKKMVVLRERIAGGIKADSEVLALAYRLAHRGNNRTDATVYNP